MTRHSAQKRNSEMTGRKRVSVGLVALWVVLAAGAHADPPVRVVVVSVDGLLPSSYATQTTSESGAPTLQRLAREGAYADGVVGVVPSITYPSHTTILTGVPPAVHGIYDNRILDPENRSREAWYWYARSIRVPTLVGAARARGLRAGLVYWPATVGLDTDFLIPEFWRSDHPEGLDLLRVLSAPRDLLDAVERAHRRPLAYPLTDRGRTDAATFIIRTWQPDLLLVHLIELDSAQHTYGPGSPEARETLARTDGYLAEIVGAVEEGGGQDRTWVIIVSDHGFAPIRQQLQPNALFKQEGLLTINSRGTVVSWQAYFHAAGGSGFVFLKDASNEALRERVHRLLTTLASKPENGIEALWTADDLRQLGAHPDAAFGIGMKEGFYTGSGHDTLLRPTTGKGGHGFAPKRPDMYASLIIVGPGLAKRGSLGVVRMTQIAPTVARLLGVTLSPAADQPIEGLVRQRE